MRSKSGYSLGEQGRPLLGVAVCPDATGLLSANSFSILTHISFTWAKTTLALTRSLPNGSLAGALNQPCGTMVWPDVPLDTGGRGETSRHQCSVDADG